MSTRNSSVRFCQNNMLAASGVTVTPSGYKTGFPVSNLWSSFRYQVWQPPGTFVITSANNLVYINDGANKTATVTAGTYTYATLAAAVQTALNAVSASWTCTYDFSGGSFTFTIGRTSGTKTLRCSVSTNAMWDTLGYVGSVDQTAAAADQPRNHTSEFFTVDFGVARAPLLFALRAAADGSFPISQSATVTLKANNVNDFTSPALTRTVTVDGDGITHWLDDLTSTSYRYWKFEFADRLNAVGPEGFALNVGYLGDYVTPLSANLINGFGRMLTDPSPTVYSNAGVRYSRKLQKYWAYQSATIQYISGSDRTAIEAALSSLGETTPFFFAVDPTQAISASASEMTKYVVFSQAPQLSHFIYDKWSLSFALREEV